MTTLATKAVSAYPTSLLRCGETGLCLFAAAFLGANDAVHMRDVDMTVECVDTNGERLLEMRTLYPGHWLFHERDAWEFSCHAQRQGDSWDVVSVDPFTGSMGDQALHDLDLWCSLARRVVTITVRRGVRIPQPPAGWKATVLRRSSKASWMVLARD